MNTFTTSDSEDGDLPPPLTLRVQAQRSKPLLTAALHVPTPPVDFDIDALSRCTNSRVQCVDSILQGIDDGTRVCLGETYSPRLSPSSGSACESQPRENSERKQPQENEV